MAKTSEKKEEKKLTEYVSVGYVVSSDLKKHIEYRLIKDGKISEKKLVFSVCRAVDYPVGWKIGIHESPEGKYSVFKLLDSDTKCVLTHEQLKEYQLQSITNSKKADIDRLRKKRLKTIETIENMTVRELREWSNKNWQRKRELRFYLLEEF